MFNHLFHRLYRETHIFRSFSSDRRIFVETLDLIRDKNLPDTSPTYVLVLCHRSWNIAERDERILGSVSISDARISSRAFIYLLLFDPVLFHRGWVETNDGTMKDEKTMKSGQLTRIPFQTDTLPHVRARESADENRHVSFLALFHRPSLLPSFPTPFPPLFPPSLLLLHPVHGKDIRCRRRPIRRARGTSDNGIIDRQRGMIAPFDDSPGCQWRNIRI